MQPSMVFGASLLIVSFVVAYGCSVGPSTQEPVIKGMEASPAPNETPLPAGCTKLPVISNGTSCRADWACSDGGTFTFECVQDPNGASCACISDSDASTVFVTPSPCESMAFGKTASGACHWEVP